MIDAEPGVVVDDDARWRTMPKETRRRPRMAYVRRDFLPPWVEEDRAAERLTLPTGRPWRLFDLIIDRMIDNPGEEPCCDLTLDEVRRVLGWSEDDFQRVWLVVRRRFKSVSGVLWWSTLERAEKAAVKSYEMQDARNILGGHSRTLWIVLLQLAGLEPEADDKEKLGLLERFARKRSQVIRCQEHLLECGGKIATRPWLIGAGKTLDAVLISMSKARTRTYRRLLKVAKILGYSPAHVKALHDDKPKLFRDLGLRHRYNVLTFNALRLALLGALEPWVWGPEWEADVSPASIVQGL